MKYMESVAFKKAYGDEPLWVKYRRNHKRQFAPQTRETCIRYFLNSLCLKYFPSDKAEYLEKALSDVFSLRQGRISTGSPCPICRDEYLVLDYRWYHDCPGAWGSENNDIVIVDGVVCDGDVDVNNHGDYDAGIDLIDYINIFFFRNVKLLQHFIDPYTGQTLPTSKTNICQKQFRLLDIEVERAKDHGLIEVDVPQVEYDYELYKKQGWGEHKWPNSLKLISF